MEKITLILLKFTLFMLRQDRDQIPESKAKLEGFFP
ncbi:hypothetical protein NIES3804_28640 [Microcystis aeruginosa NIES-3804]|uniref:Uncharacterized protein n=1 Tax=Microcystis aeruginosa NIES-3804 TaxID=2517783 RepID=A0A6H9GVL2_MICAE|nr:hypothetical protein NIES3804_28640 [Microcystis aeruginosa NIES-3804]